ncbi:MAG: ABC transporter substrate-binding protein [Caryophanon sp.]|nr:ABC transporter substrate-binding protein [Caryophanon sp.]
MKKYATILLALAATTSLAACGDEETSNTLAANGQDNVLQYQSTAGAVSLPELAEELGYFEDITLENVGPSTGGPESIQLTSIGETDFGNAFNGAIIKSVAKGVPIQAVVSSYGSDELTDNALYVLKDSGIDHPDDLVGKKIGMNTLGAHAEFFVTDYLRSGGLSEKDIKEAQPVVVPASSSIQTLKQKQLDAVVLGGLSAQLAQRDEAIVKLVSDVDVYNQTFAAGTYFFTKEYIEKNPDTVRTFTTGVAKALEWSREQPRDTLIDTFTTIIEKREGNETTENVQYFTSFGVPAANAAIQENEFSLWIDWLVKKGELEEGIIELDELYTNEFNDTLQ